MSWWYSTELVAGALTGEFDLGQALGAALFAGVSSFATDLISIDTFGLDLGPNADVALLAFGKKLTLTAIVESGIDSAITAGLSSAVYGSDFGSGFLNSFSSSIVTLATADFQTLIGDQELKEGGLAHAGLHGLVGCLSAAATGADCASGALGGVVQSVYAGTLEGKGPAREDYGSDEAYAAAYNGWKAKVGTNANLIGGAVGYVFSGGSAANVSATASIAKSGILNNYLTHNQWAVYRTSLEACGDDEDCRNVIHKWAEQTALTNHAAFLSCGEDRACLNEHFDQIEYEGDMSFATGLVQSLQAKDYYFASNSYLSNADGLQFLEFQSANCANVSDARCAGVWRKMRPNGRVYC